MKTLNENVLRRALGDKGFEEIYQQYCDARQNGRSATPPTAAHIRLANLVRKHGAKKAGEMAGVPTSTADYALSRVARWEWLNGKK